MFIEDEKSLVYIAQNQKEIANFALNFGRRAYRIAQLAVNQCVKDDKHNIS